MKSLVLLLPVFLQICCVKGYSNELPQETLDKVIELIKIKSYSKLINDYFSEDMKIRFVPHSMLSRNDISLSKQEILDYWNKNTTIHWGNFEGSGLPIDLTIRDYFHNYISLDPEEHYKISINKRILETDSSESVYKEYGKDVVVDILSNWDSPNEWQGIKIVFKYEKESWRIICLVFNRYEI